MINTFFYGICLTHPDSMVSVDDNDIYVVGEAFNNMFGYGIGIIYGTEVVAIQQDFSYSRNKIVSVHGS